MNFSDQCLAITLNTRNLKAHFRKAQALKMLADYVGAKVSAEFGWKIAEEGKNSADVSLFLRIFSCSLLDYLYRVHVILQNSCIMTLDLLLLAYQSSYIM